jgi:hypothetical protein
MANDLWTGEQFDKLWAGTSALKAKLIESNDNEAAKAKVTFALPEDCRGQLIGLNNS